MFYIFRSLLAIRWFGEGKNRYIMVNYCWPLAPIQIQEAFSVKFHGADRAEWSDFTCATPNISAFCIILPTYFTTSDTYIAEKWILEYRGWLLGKNLVIHLHVLKNELQGRSPNQFSRKRPRSCGWGENCRNSKGDPLTSFLVSDRETADKEKIVNNRHISIPRKSLLINAF